MSAQAGRNLLLKIADNSTPSGYRAIAGLRAKSLAFSAKTIDATSADSPDNWRQALAGVGLKEATIAGQGVFVDDASQARLQGAFFDQSATDYQIIVPGLGVISGPFLVVALEYSGSHDAEALFSTTLTSAGALSFVAAP